MAEQNEIPTQNVDELDDFEAHGLREVAAAAGIGAAVLGAGGIAMASGGGGAHPVPQNRIVSNAVHGADQLAGDATHGATALAQQTAGDAAAFGGQTVSDTEAFTQPEVSLATNTADSTTTYALARTDAAEHTAMQTAGGVETLTFRTADGAERTTFSTAGGAEGTATTEVSSVESTTLRIEKATYDAVDKGWTLELNVLGIDAKTGGNMLVPNGEVTIVDANGHTIASTGVVDGRAILRVATTSTDNLIHYAGTQHFRASKLPWLPPTM